MNRLINWVQTALAPAGWLIPPDQSDRPQRTRADSYEQAGIGESPPSSDARHFFCFTNLRRFYIVVNVGTALERAEINS